MRQAAPFCGTMRAPAKQSTGGNRTERASPSGFLRSIIMVDKIFTGIAVIIFLLALGVLVYAFLIIYRVVQ